MEDSTKLVLFPSAWTREVNQTHGPVELQKVIRGNGGAHGNRSLRASGRGFEAAFHIITREQFLHLLKKKKKKKVIC